MTTKCTKLFLNRKQTQQQHLENSSENLIELKLKIANFQTKKPLFSHVAIHQYPQSSLRLRASSHIQSTVPPILQSQSEKPAISRRIRFGRSNERTPRVDRINPYGTESKQKENIVARFRLISRKAGIRKILKKKPEEFES